VNLLAAKARKTILNVAPADCGKSTATDLVARIVGDRAWRRDSLTFASLKHHQQKFTNATMHVIVDDAAMDRSIWSRVSTISVLANIVYRGYASKSTHSYTIEIENFSGSAALNIQPAAMQTLVSATEGGKAGQRRKSKNI